MGASYQEFAAQHRADHLTAFNRWCAVLGNYSLVPTAIALLLGRPRVAAAFFGLGTAIIGAGHVVEGNLPRNVGYLIRHPIWAVRADIALANDTIMGLVRQK
jgi:hypothetical protein